MGNSTGNPDNKLRQQAKMIRQRRNARTGWDKKKKKQPQELKQTIQLEEIN